MNTDHIAEQVLNAFRIEHREQLDQLRHLFDLLAEENEPSTDAVREALRLAHSFKGGARVCDLRPPEQLGHALEAVLEKMGNGELRAGDDVLQTLIAVLDTIEDWMHAFEQGSDLPATDDTLNRLRLLLPDENNATESIVQVDDLLARLLPAFEAERDAYLQQLTHFVDLLQDKHVAPAADDLEEAHRLAHTLAGAAEVVGRAETVALAMTLESPLSRVEGDTADREAAVAEIKSILGQLQTLAADTSCGVDRLSHRSQARAAPDDTPAAEGIAARALDGRNETLRVSAASLDGLMRATDRMLAETQYQTSLSQELLDLGRHVDELDRELALRDTQLQRKTSSAEEHPAKEYLSHVEHQVHELSLRLRQLNRSQETVAWRLRTHGLQLQREVRRARTIAAHDVLQGFRKLVRDQAQGEGKELEFELRGSEVRVDRTVLQTLKDPLMHILRNCITHGIESPAERTAAGKSSRGRILLQFSVGGRGLYITIEDDGRGLDLEKIRQVAIQRGLLRDENETRPSKRDLAALLFEPGFTTSSAVTELAGRGMGLSVVAEAVRQLQGEVTVEPLQQGGTRFQLSLPLTVSTRRTLLVECNEQRFGLPLDSIQRVLKLATQQIEDIEGRPCIVYGRESIPLAELAELLELTPVSGDSARSNAVVIVKSGGRRLALLVESIIGEHDGFVKDLDRFACHRRFLGGLPIESNGVILLLNPGELIEQSMSRHRSSGFNPRGAEAASPAPTRVLVVDDSFTTRTLEKSILEAHGYDVSVAVDGEDALTRLRREPFAVVISDIEMPSMDGFALLNQIKGDPKLSKIPVILVTSRDKQEDQQRGLNLGAEAYIVKRKFDHQVLLNTISQVL